LFDISRFAGEDAVETGLHGAFGVSWTRIGSSGTTSKLTVGRVLHDTVQDDFTLSSGLDELRSDWLIDGQIEIAGGFFLNAHGLFDEDGGLNRADGRVAWQNEQISLAAAYIWQSEDAEEDRPDTISEWTVDADFELSEAWSLNLDARYDVATDQPVRAGGGLQWRNECVSIDVSASRRFTSSDTVDPTTTYGLSGSITGFSAGRAGSGLAAGCKN
jgi:LPS-assembly protein